MNWRYMRMVLIVLLGLPVWIQPAHAQKSAAPSAPAPNSNASLAPVAGQVASEAKSVTSNAMALCTEQPAGCGEAVSRWRIFHRASSPYGTDCDSRRAFLLFVFGSTREYFADRYTNQPFVWPGKGYGSYNCGSHSSWQPGAP